LAHSGSERSAAATRDWHTNAAGEYREQRTRASTPEFAHGVEPDQRASMRANKAMLLHALFEHLQRLA
jgi:hypothetical protein